MTGQVFPLRDIEVEALVDSPWPGTAIAGDPHTRTWNRHTSDDGRMLAGDWESTPGVWRIDYTAWEYCHLLEGRCTIALEGKAPVELKAGDIFVIESGAKGTWTVHETIRKHYVFALDH